ncbi:hypothetical protein GCM10009530_06580 [Microbispora corallina]|uniref:Pectate lyase n=1 Tax=Microbispora corallina TaxID=83302 RepID=A0ABQ4FUW5_9ACTN|nr:hypothetical protein [Microbispora corallina]GIH38621.1 hypothetical protein Mco01_16210 [Microbispora corallina]
MRDQIGMRRAGIAPLARRLASAALVVAAASGAVTSTAQAASAPPAGILVAGHGGGGGSTNINTGHASRNKNYAAVNSPTMFRGDQNVAISISGQTNTQLGFCKKWVKHCHINLSSWLD